MAAITAEPHVPVDGETGEAPFAVAVPGRTVAGIAKVPAGSDEVMFIPEYKEKPPEDEAEALPEEKYGVAYYLDMAKTGISKAKGKAKGLTHKVKANVVDKVKAKLFTQKQAEEESDGELSPDSATDNEDALLEETAKRLKAWRGDHNPNKEHPTKTPPAPHSDALVVAEIDYMTGQPVDDPYTLVQELQYSHLGRLAQEAPAAADGMDMDADSQADEDVPENRGLKLREEDLPLLPKWGLMVSATHRTDWMKRYRLATEMGEGSLGEEVAKFKEMVSVMRDFLRAATDHGKAIIEEQFLTPSHRPIPNEIRLTARDGVTSDVFVRSNIWFRVITDRHGMYVRRCVGVVACCVVCVWVLTCAVCRSFNGDDELAMKGAGAYVRAAREYMKCHIPGLNIPFVCCIDFRGFRCLAVAGVPIGPSSGGTIGLLQDLDVKPDKLGLGGGGGGAKAARLANSAAKNLVLGSLDCGETVRNLDPSLANKMKAAAKTLNLAAHTVRGSEDISGKTMFVRARACVCVCVCVVPVCCSPSTHSCVVLVWAWVCPATLQQTCVGTRAWTAATTCSTSTVVCLLRIPVPRLTSHRLSAACRYSGGSCAPSL